MTLQGFVNWVRMFLISFIDDVTYKVNFGSTLLNSFYACILLNSNIAYHTTKSFQLFKMTVNNEK